VIFKRKRKKKKYSKKRKKRNKEKLCKQIRKMYDRSVKWKLQRTIDPEQALYTSDARSQVRLNPAVP